MLKSLDKLVKAAESPILTLYHGSKTIVDKPRFGFGSKDNDYGQGFYTTDVYSKA